ncbi:MAG TPA: linear amide C-N hydrolase [Myxococcota bacterium]|nr:linear amide C-N hydrolase [Myxococcota bacterium]HRY92193.1 linear amide C-N hydrolase [Myxococcota bacterium]HSA21872.1 linear amide C-N hydrolase [Myxococcota bacterium]
MRHPRLVGALFAFALPALSPADTRACTAFLLEQDGEVAVAKSYDWDQGAALVIWNKRGVAKASLPLPTLSRPHQWYSRYASLTFNQYGRELPVGGMNEAGLMVETLWLESGQNEPVDDRPALNELQWVQWVLDSFARVEEVVAAAPGVRIERVYGKGHYLVCDRRAECAVFELLGGKLEIRAGDALPVRALANNTYDDSLTSLRGHRGFGGDRPLPEGPRSLARFTRAAAAAGAPASREPVVARAFGILDAVSQGDFSKWNLVYLLKAGKVVFRTSTHRPAREVALGRLDPACGTPVRMLDIQAELEGDVTGRFQDWTQAANRDLLRVTFKDLPLPPGLGELVSAFPETLPCLPAGTH